MVNLLIAFVTGLTTGGLSCLAVQGGLLASSLANQIEKDLRTSSAALNKKKTRTESADRDRRGLSQPILVFLAAKLLAYTLLGFLLGWIGQMFQLSPYTRAFLQIAIGIFMLGSALRMLNIHPIFRYFAFEPPAFLRRKLRRTAANANGASLVTAALLGCLTVLIPCGVTQAMMAVALSAANPFESAALMFAFTLGASPVFFVVAYFATQLGAKLEKHFMRFVAIVMLVLAVITIDSGIALAGSPVSLTRLASSLSGSKSQEVVSTTVEAVTKPVLPFNETTVEQPRAVEDPLAGNVVTVSVENDGYTPGIVHARAGIPIKLRLVSKDVYSCSRAFVIPSLGVQEILAETGETVIDIPAQQAGTEIPFSCSMGMFGGTIVFDG